MKETLGNLQESLDHLRLTVKYLVFDLEAAISFVIGVIGCCVYWSMLCDHVDTLGPSEDFDLKQTSLNKWRSAKKTDADKFKELPANILKGVKTGVFHKRMLVPFGLTAAVSAFNYLELSVYGRDLHIGLNCVLGGFFVYRVALLYQVWLDLLYNLYNSGRYEYLPTDVGEASSNVRVEQNPFANIKAGIARSIEELQKE